jgi:hypothetical protein
MADEKTTDPQVIPTCSTQTRAPPWTGWELQLDGGGVIMMGSAGLAVLLGEGSRRSSVVFHGARQLIGLTIAGLRASSRHRGK